MPWFADRFSAHHGALHQAGLVLRLLGMCLTFYDATEYFGLQRSRYVDWTVYHGYWGHDGNSRVFLC